MVPNADFVWNTTIAIWQIRRGGFLDEDLPGDEYRDWHKTIDG